MAGFCIGFFHMSKIWDVGDAMIGCGWAFSVRGEGDGGMGIWRSGGEEMV